MLHQRGCWLALHLSCSTLGNVPLSGIYPSYFFHSHVLIPIPRIISRAVRLKNYVRKLMQQQSLILSKKLVFIILFNDLCYCFPYYISYWSLVLLSILYPLLTSSICYCIYGKLTWPDGHNIQLEWHCIA